MVKETKKPFNKYFNTNNLVKILGMLALFFIYETYDGIKDIGNKIIEHETRLSIVEYIIKAEAKNER